MALLLPAAMPTNSNRPTHIILDWDLHMLGCGRKPGTGSLGYPDSGVLDNLLDNCSTQSAFQNQHAGARRNFVIAAARLHYATWLHIGT